MPQHGHPDALDHAFHESFGTGLARNYGCSETGATFGAAHSGTGPGASSRCPDRVAPPTLRPERIVRLNSSGLLIRDCCGSTTPPASRGDPGAPGRFSDGELLAALAAARGKDCAASTGTHTLTEAVDLGPPAVVRLERALAHWDSRSFGKLSSIKGRHVVRRALKGMGAPDMAQPVNGTGDPRAGQTKRLRGVKTPRFPQRTYRRRLRLWKIKVSRSPSGGW